MGLAASQARFLELTKRRGDIEYQAQRINFERMQLANKQSAASEKYNETMSNRILTYTFNTGVEKQTVDLTYQNYKNYMNTDTGTSNQKLFLVSSSGNKIVVSSEEEITEIMSQNLEKYSIDEVNEAKEAVRKEQEASSQGTGSEDANTATNETIKATDRQRMLAEKDFSGYEIKDGFYVNSKFTKEDFLVTDGLDSTENFQKAIREGIYYFATYGQETGEDKAKFKTLDWETLGSGAINDEYDKSDDAAAQAEYDNTMSTIQATDKKLELRLKELETERESIQAEIESVQKVVDDNVEASYKTFG